MSQLVPNLPPKNHVHISQPQNAIQGTWVLDTTIKLPRHIATHAADGSVRPNLKLEAFKGAITAEVYLVARDWKPALMELGTHKGNISLRLTRAARQTVRLVIRSHSGSVTIYVPRDLCGHLTYTGTATFSPPAETFLSAFSHTEVRPTPAHPRRRFRFTHPTVSESNDSDIIEIDTGGKIRFCVFGEDHQVEDDSQRSIRSQETRASSVAAGRRSSVTSTMSSAWKNIFSGGSSSTRRRASSIAPS